MSRTTITPTRVKAILIIASLMPVYMAGYVSSGRDVFSGMFFTLFAVVTLLHLYYGYKWAKFTVALSSLFFAVAQFFMFKVVFTDLRVLFFLLFCALLIINTVLLLRANAVSVFLSQQGGGRGKQALFYIKLSRWTLFGVIGVGIMKDLMRLA
jgi:hypothetical protein